MQLVPADLSPKTPNETVHVKWKLSPALNTDTVASVVWSSNPPGLSFANPTTTDAAKSIEVDVGSGVASKIYTVSALVTLASGAVREAWARMPVQSAGIYETRR